MKHRTDIAAECTERRPNAFTTHDGEPRTSGSGLIRACRGWVIGVEFRSFTPQTRPCRHDLADGAPWLRLPVVGLAPRPLTQLLGRLVLAA